MTGRYQAYPEYKDSGVEWLGDVPAHWIVAKTSRFFKIAMGATILKEDLVDEGVLPVFSATDGDHYFGRVNQSQVRLFSGDLVIPARGNSIGAVKIVKEPSTTTQTTIYCKKISSKLTSSYVFYFMRGNKNNLFYFTQTAIPQITVEEVSTNPITIPSQEEQQQIANFLDHETAKIDTLIEKQQQLIQLLKEKRQAVISHAVTKGLNPDVPMRDSGVEWLGEVPEHWEVKRISLLFSESSARAFSDIELEYPVLSVSIHHGISDKELSEKELDRKVTRSEDKSLYKVVHDNDLTYNMMRAWQGGFGASKLSGLVSPAYVVCKPKTRLNSYYFELVLRTPNAVTELKRYSRGITDFRLRLYWDEFKNIYVPVPTDDEINSILNSITVISNKYENLILVSERQIELLHERRTALISAAVTGKIDVRNWQPAKGVTT